MEESLEIVYSLLLKFIMLTVVVATGLHFTNGTNITEITKAYAEQTAVTGGFTTFQYSDMIKELGKMGYESSQLTIKVTGQLSNGTSINSKVINVTPMEQSPYPNTPNFAPRGSKITLEITTTQESNLNSAYKLLGISTNIKRGYSRISYMSERVE